MASFTKNVLVFNKFGKAERMDTFDAENNEAEECMDSRGQ